MASSSIRLPAVEVPLANRAQEHPAAETDEQAGQDVDRPQGRLDRDAGAAGRFLVGADRVDPATPHGPVQQERDQRHHHDPDDGQHRDAERPWSARSAANVAAASGVIGMPLPYA